MKNSRCCIIIILIIVSVLAVKAQGKFITDAPPAKRLQVFWQYCSSELISDRDSLTVHRFLDEVIEKADSLNDNQLKAYAQYFKKCWRILFSAAYEKNFTAGDYQSAINILYSTQSWALKNKYEDIAASCEHYTGQVYYRANRYGLAFEHLLKADDAFKKIGYKNVPNSADYLYALGLRFYQFTEYDKALERLLSAIDYEFYMPRTQLNTFNAIGLIYANKNEPLKAISFFKNTITKAQQYNDQAWVGIAAGNLGNVLMAENKDDSALFYHRENYYINTNTKSRAPEDAAKSAISIATIYLKKHNLDSTLYYANSGKALAAYSISDSTESLDFRKRFLKVMIDYQKEKGGFREALLLMDSLSLAEQKLRSRLDNKILSRAAEKTESISYNKSLALLKSQKNLDQLRFYFVITALVIILLSVIFIFRDKWLRKKRQVQLSEKDKQILLAEKLRAEDGLNLSKELLNAYIDMVKEKTTLIEHLESKLNDLKEVTLQMPEVNVATSNRQKLMMGTILTDNDWQQFRALFEQVYPGFSYRLKITYPELSPAEARFLFLTKLNLSSKEMAAMLGISVEAIHKLRYRLRKKLNLEEAIGFEGLIEKIR